MRKHFEAGLIFKPVAVFIKLFFNTNVILARAFDPSKQTDPSLIFLCRDLEGNGCRSQIRQMSYSGHLISVINSKKLECLFTHGWKYLLGTNALAY
jgi:hypothetical protein